MLAHFSLNLLPAEAGLNGGLNKLSIRKEVISARLSEQ